MTTHPTPTELLACPFCGGDPSIRPYMKNGLEIRCGGCHVALRQRVLRNSIEWLREKMVLDWNRRAHTLSAREDGWQRIDPANTALLRLADQLDVLTRSFPTTGFYVATGEIVDKMRKLAGRRDGCSLIAAERARQVYAEGWTPEHDDEHEGDDLALAAACYAMPPDRYLRSHQPPLSWPWEEAYWKPGDRIRELVKAGALCAAEIDRLQRAAPKH